MKKKSDVEIAKEATANALRAMAQEKLTDNSDVVKQLKSMAARAQAFSIRDKQLEEKKSRERIDAELDRRQDIIMEIDRVKDIKRREDLEAEKLQKRKEDGKVITEQIEARRRARLLEAEARDQEAQQMVAKMKALEEQDAIIAKKRAAEVAKSREEVMRANEAFIESKKAAKAAEIKEMEDLLLYQAMKDKELAEREAEEAAKEAAKKERQAKLLEQQERAQDNAGKMDELRARRAAEEYERRMRREEKEKAAKKRADTLDLLESRAKQHADKLQLAARRKRWRRKKCVRGLCMLKRWTSGRLLIRLTRKRWLISTVTRSMSKSRLVLKLGWTLVAISLRTVIAIARRDLLRWPSLTSSVIIWSKKLEDAGVNPAYLRRDEEC